MSRLQDDYTMVLMESGSLAAYPLTNANTAAHTIQQVEIHRGMTVQTSEGQRAGHVAAVILDQKQHRVTHFLLQEPQRLIYRLVPVELIAQVADEEIWLQVLKPATGLMPIWHSA